MTDFARIARESKASQGPAELEWLLRKVAAINPKVILELGVHNGYSIQTWFEAFNVDTIYGIDIELTPTCTAWAQKQTDLVLWQRDSHDIVTEHLLREQLGTIGKLDFLFIDGDHTIEGVRQDYDMYRKHVRPGGIIAFHDACHMDPPAAVVPLFIEELMQTAVVEVYCDGFTGVAITRA